MIKYIYIAIAIIILAIVAYGYFNTDRRTDEAKIDEVVYDIVAGANSRNLSQCMSNASADFRTESDINKDQLRVLVAQAFKSETSFRVTTTMKSLTINGDDAQAVVYVSIKGWDQGSGNYEKDVNVKFKKEKSRRLLLIPSSNWKVTYIDSLVVGGGEEQIL